MTMIGKIFDTIVEKLVNFVFYLIVIVTVYVFVNVLLTKYSLLISFIISGILIICIRKIKKNLLLVLNQIISFLNKCKIVKLVLFIVIVLIIERLLVLLLFHFPTFTIGDTSIYKSFADLISFGTPMQSQTIYPHVFFVGLFLSVFNLFRIAYVDGMFLLFVISIIFYFISFSKIIGQGKAFIAISLYIMMPSSIFWTFSLTHEMFYFFFTSIICYLFFEILISNKISIVKSLIIFLLLLLNLSVNPMSTILLIALVICTLLFLKARWISKILFIVLVCFSVILSPKFSEVLSSRILGYEVRSAPFQANLLVGSSIKSDGRLDEDLIQEVKKQIIIRKMPNTIESYKTVAWEYTLKNYSYLITHPIDLLKLIATKFYIAWSGDHYSLEMLLNYKAYFIISPGLTNILQLAMLSISALIYLFAVLIGTFKNSEYSNNSSMKFAKTLFLGIVAALLIVEITNKYSIHTTIFILMIAMSKIESNYLEKKEEIT